ncbi:surfeit locus 1 family protein [Jannaschia faecimaris]|uniref:SURF1-like protein n=1 Tax=Jannaschia faecimaris TaxID=1244108 RepID=A0A1H3MJU0_9RHOB|nr:SURF1 family protein [Jannaschia faecimaris]SDY76870.1 surfeit locus 1 family protein [Jannaschia faecimaris]
MRFVIPALFGLTGFAVLCALGVWQLQRMDWKHAMIAEIASRIDAVPVPLPDKPVESTDNFTPVTLTGTVDGEPLRVLGAWRAAGTGFRIIAPVLTDGRRVMVDLGVLPVDAADTLVLPRTSLRITGNLNWPDDQNAGTPEPDGTNWYARDVGPMAQALGTESVMVVAAQVEPPLPITHVPVGIDGIPDNHLGYAIQWFGLAAVWVGMTLFLLWRIRRRTI